MKLKMIIAFLLFGFITNAQVRNYVKSGSKINQTKSPEKKSKKSNQNADSPLNFGILAGVNLSNEKSSDFDLDSKSRTGFYVGGFMERTWEKYAIEVDLKYATMGAKLFEDQLLDDLTYIQLASIFKIKIIDPLCIDVGPQLGYLLSAKFDGEDYIDDLNKLDGGILAGLSADIPGSKISINARYYFGLISNYKDSDFDKKNNAISIGLNYSF